MPQPIIYLDDNPVDLDVMRRCHELSGSEQPLLAMQWPEQLFEHMDRVAAGDEPLPELMLIDIRMPTTDGFVVVERLVKKYGAHLPPVVFFTTSTRAGDLARAHTLGAKLVQKPIEIEGYVELFQRGFAA